MNINQLLYSLCFCFFLCSCSTPSIQSSYAPAILSNSNAHKVIDDLIVLLQQEYVPSETIFTLTESDNHHFRELLQTQLRRAGYGVRYSDQTVSSLMMVYVIDSLNMGNLYRVSLSVSPQFQINALYRQGVDGQWLPTGTITVQNKQNNFLRSPEPPRQLMTQTEAMTLANTSTSQQGQWLVQVMAGDNLTALQAQQFQLEQKGYPAFIAQLKSYQTMKALRIGAYATHQQAQSTLDGLKPQFNDAFLIQTHR